MQHFMSIQTLVTMMAFWGFQNQDDLPTVATVNLDKYVGTWYEITRIPNRFEKGLTCITATYSFRDDGKIKVLNQGQSIRREGKQKQAVGRAWVPDESKPGQLKVSFFGPFAGDYYIIDLAEDYSHALVGSPSRKYLWILSRTPEMEDSLRNKLLNKARMLGFDTATMISVKHDCTD